MDANSGVVLFQYGLAGVVIIGLALTVRFLYQENVRLNKELNSQVEARRMDAIEARDKIMTPLESLAQTTKFIYEKLSTSKEGA